MVAESERYQKEDDAIKEKAEAKQKMENYMYQVKSSLEGDMKDKVDSKTKSEIDEKIKEITNLCDSFDFKEKEVYETAQKDLETVFMKFMNTQMPSTDKPVSEPTQAPDVEDPHFEPKIEEID